MKRRWFTLGWVVSVLALWARLAHAGDLTTRVSVDSAGNQGNKSSETPAISANGRFVAFGSSADNLVPGDTNAISDVFAHDRLTGTTTRRSLDIHGNQILGSSVEPSISGDGRYVAFICRGQPDPNLRDWLVWVHDSVTGSTTCASVSSSGENAREPCRTPAINADGRYVAFATKSTNLGPGPDPYRADDVFVHDRQTGETSLVSVDSSGNQLDDDSLNPCMSADGRYVAFESWAEFEAGDSLFWDVLVHDRVTGTTSYVSVDSQGVRGNHNSVNASISEDGRYVAFASRATNLVNLPHADTNLSADVFRHDRATGATILVSIDASGTAVGNDWSDEPSISADGRHVAFRSSASNLVAGDTNAAPDAFLHDCETGRTTRVTVSADGGESNGISRYANISADARFVAFQSDADNLVHGDSNEAQDVFVRGRELTLEADPLVVSTGQVLTLTSYRGVPGNGASLWAVAMNGAPVFRMLLIGSFTTSGLFTAAGMVPAGFANGDVTFRSYCIGIAGDVVATNDVTVDFQ